MNIAISIAFFIVGLVLVIYFAEKLVRSSETIIGRLGISDTVFGMTILAFLISIEELARELLAARKGRPEISFGDPCLFLVQCRVHRFGASRPG